MLQPIDSVLECGSVFHINILCLLHMLKNSSTVKLYIIKDRCNLYQRIGLSGLDKTRKNI